MTRGLPRTDTDHFPQTRLGRGQGSVENKYGRIMHKDEWKNYSSSYEATLQPKDTNAEDDECESPSS